MVGGLHKNQVTVILRRFHLGGFALPSWSWLGWINLRINWRFAWEIKRIERRALVFDRKNQTQSKDEQQFQEINGHIVNLYLNHLYHQLIINHNICSELIANSPIIIWLMVVSAIGDTW